METEVIVEKIGWWYYIIVTENKKRFIYDLALTKRRAHKIVKNYYKLKKLLKR